MNRFFIIAIILFNFFCASCITGSESVTTKNKLDGLWAVTYSNNSNYQEVFIKDSLFSVADEGVRIVYRQLDFVGDSIRLYHDSKIYLVGKVDYLSRNKIAITFNGSKSELVRIDKYLLSDSIMNAIIEGNEVNEEMEQLWWERFIARKYEWLEEGKD